MVEGETEEGYLEWEPGTARDGKEVRIAAHTIVPRAIGGRGVAAALVERLVEDAGRQDFLIRPDCSYVAAKFSENPDWAALKA
ncbi:acetyltransferase [Porphyrobacter sp. AAP60]|nr:acetyltransferase [Porphyrobacter sp. AAP60]